MCLGNYAEQVQGNVGKSVGMWLNPDDDRPQQMPPTVNVYNTLPSGDIRRSGEIRRAGDFGQKGDVNTYPNRSSLQSGKK